MRRTQEYIPGRCIDPDTLRYDLEQQDQADRELEAWADRETIANFQEDANPRPDKGLTIGELMALVRISECMQSYSIRERAPSKPVEVAEHMKPAAASLCRLGYAEEVADRPGFFVLTVAGERKQKQEREDFTQSISRKRVPKQ